MPELVGRSTKYRPLINVVDTYVRYELPVRLITAGQWGTSPVSVGELYLEEMMYLIKRGALPGKKWVAHVWHGDYPNSMEGDTACRMWSTGGIRKKDRYFVTPTPIHISPKGVKTELPICHMCQGNSGGKQ